VNGHTDQITKDYYLLLSRIDERKGTERFAQLMRGEQVENENDSDSENEIEEQLQFKQVFKPNGVLTNSFNSLIAE